MRNVALLYATRYGQTEKIAREMQRRLEDGGCVVEAYNLKNVTPTLGPQIDGVIIGGPVYAGNFHRVLRKWVRRNQTALKDKRLGLFVVALNTADKHDKARLDDNGLLRKFIDWTGVVPDDIANFAGALKYTKYPSFLRPQMKKIAAAAGGDTDTTKDFEYTDWNTVTAFCDDFRKPKEASRFATAKRFQDDAAFDSQMRLFEQSSQSKIRVAAPANVAYEAFSKADSNEMTGAKALASVRTLGTGHAPKDSSFAGASQEFGVVPLGDKPSRELLGGLVGRFWRFDFGIRKMAPGDFASFEEPGFTKVLTRFEFVDVAEGQSEIRATMRIHSTDPRASRAFRIYWTLLSIGISLYMRSVLRGLKRQAERQRQGSLRAAYR